MDKLINDFVSWEERVFKFKLGKVLASALSGFIAGVVFASLVWIIATYVFEMLLK